MSPNTQCKHTVLLTPKQRYHGINQDAAQFAKENGCLFLETSARTGSNVKELFEMIGTQWLTPCGYAFGCAWRSQCMCVCLCAAREAPRQCRKIQSTPGTPAQGFQVVRIGRRSDSFDGTGLGLADGDGGRGAGAGGRRKCC